MVGSVSQAAIALQQKIRSTIPLSEAMQFEITELDANSIQVHAPLGPNVNIHGTGFAGSIYSLAVLTGWAMCAHIMSLNDLQGELVVGKAEIKYRRAVIDDIDCQCRVAEDDISHLKQQFVAKGKSRLALKITIGDEQAVLNASFYITSRT